MDEKEERVRELGAAIRLCVTDFFVPLQTTRVVKIEAFERLDHAAKELAKVLKGDEMVPKSLLNELRASIQTLENEAPYHREHREQLEEMAASLTMTFDLILLDESHEDRQPGVPRVI